MTSIPATPNTATPNITVPLETIIEGYHEECSKGAGHRIIDQQLTERRYVAEEYAIDKRHNGTVYTREQDGRTDIFLTIEYQEPVFFSGDAKKAKEARQMLEKLEQKQYDDKPEIKMTVESAVAGGVGGGLIGQSLDAACVGALAGAVTGFVVAMRHYPKKRSLAVAGMEQQLAQYGKFEKGPTAIYAALGYGPQD
jgi:hypothetical protein